MGISLTEIVWIDYNFQTAWKSRKLNFGAHVTFSNPRWYGIIAIFLLHLYVYVQNAWAFMKYILKSLQIKQIWWCIICPLNTGCIFVCKVEHKYWCAYIFQMPSQLLKDSAIPAIDALQTIRCVNGMYLHYPGS